MLNLHQIAPEHDFDATLLYIICPVIDALTYMHSKRLLYRDLKVENIMVARNEAIKLVDFGLVIEEERVEPGLIGTVSYMAPELFCGEIYTQKSEAYSLGILINHLFLFNRMNFLIFSRIHPEDEKTIQTLTQLAKSYKNNQDEKSKEKFLSHFCCSKKNIEKFIEYERYTDVMEKFHSRFVHMTPEKRVSISEVRDEMWIKDWILMAHEEKSPNDVFIKVRKSILKVNLVYFNLLKITPYLCLRRLIARKHDGHELLRKWNARFRYEQFRKYKFVL